jgi:hypothetical protein
MERAPADDEAPSDGQPETRPPDCGNGDWPAGHRANPNAPEPERFALFFHFSGYYMPIDT